MNLKWKKHDEEISSDEDSGDDEKMKDNDDDDSEDEEEDKIETAEEKRRRLAKGYLEQMGNLVEKDEEGSAEEDFDGHLSERLRRDRLKKKRKVL